MSTQMNYEKLLTENFKLKKAIRESGYSILKASNKWSIVDVSEAAKQEEEKTFEIANQIIDLEVYADKTVKMFKRILGIHSGRLNAEVISDIEELLSEAEKLSLEEEEVAS